MSAVPGRLPDDATIASGVEVAALTLTPTRPWDRGFWHEWTPGERGAVAALDAFARAGVSDYAEMRDRPDVRGTSRLSPHLHFGEITPWRVMRALGGEGSPTGEVDSFVRELGWREFAHHVLHHFPHTPDRNFDARFDAFPWQRASESVLDAWRRGQTGLPLVDAGMRELWATGWMHNRVRMMVASVLTKNLGLHWLTGARWFWDTLLDADLANNTLGWQWVAGTGVDAAPYFRVFNPVTQAKKFDPQGRYIARWVPELAQLPVVLRHEPWLDPDRVRASGSGYPSRPLVDLAASRGAALNAYRGLRRA
jgi:deoxyribodipyrimidine photo-lyase